MYGKKYNFQKLRTIKILDNIPIYTYEELEKYIGLIRMEKETFYGLEKLKDRTSSGTSNESKYSISKECSVNCHYKPEKTCYAFIKKLSIR